MHPPQKQWHQLSSEETVSHLNSNTKTGLNEAQVHQRQEQYGPNSITTHKAESPFLRFMRQFHQPLIYILIGSGVTTGLLGEWVDSVVIFGVVMANAIVGYLQEAKAINSLAALAKTMISEAKVLRGRKMRISSSEVVPGDIILLQPGDKVPADLRLIKEQGLQVDESALTGESLPVDKSLPPLDPETNLPDRHNMAYASTLITHGQAKGIAVAIGDSTEVGRISMLISKAEDLQTPLTQKISDFSNFILYIILSLAAVTVIVGLIRGLSLFDMFMAAVALAVGAIPEGLPAAVTVTLAIGVSRMARRKAIIRKLPAVETLGSTTVICSDKTGTLTENKMTVQEIVAGDNHFDLTGVGYKPDSGQIFHQGHNIDLSKHNALEECLKAGQLCNESALTHKLDEWVIEGDPTEGALLVSAAKAGINLTEISEKHTLIDSVPFESHHQFMASLFGRKDGQKIIYVKGSMEVILSGCISQLTDSGETIALEKQKIIKQAEHMAHKGLRVLAFAYKTCAEDVQSIHSGNTLNNLTFLGLQGMLDPPRQEAVKAVSVCRDAGISVKMITGDHALTAKAIARQIGIAKTDTADLVLTGTQLDELNDNELIEAVKVTDIFARTTPEQKLRLVKALQSLYHIVAMTGDGVNDAPALRQADIGVAMGISGTEVAKETADMVLTNDNFSSIKAAVEEGRGVFDNLTKFIVWTLPTNLGEGLVIMVAIFLGVTLPILPVQILWINMTTAGFLGLMLAFEPKEPGIMQRPPRDPQQPILTRTLINRIILVGLLLLVFTFILFKVELNRGADIEQARTVAVNTFVIIELCYLFNCRSLSRSLFSLGPFSNLWVIYGASVMFAIQLLYTYVPFMNFLFESAPISIRSWLYILGAGIISGLIIEAEKQIYYRSKKG